MVCSRLAILSCVLFATACTYQTPPRTDPLADLLGGAKVADAPNRTISDAKSKRLALIVSTSSETQIKSREDADKQYLEGYIKSWEPRSYGPVKAQQDSVGPRKLIDGVVAELRSRFQSVTVVSDLAAFREQGLDVAAVVDIGMEAKGSSTPAANIAEYTTDVTLIFFDPQIRKIGTASGKATERGERSNAGDMGRALLLFLPDPKPEEVMEPLIRAEQKSRASAFQLLRASLSEIVKN